MYRRVGPVLRAKGEAECVSLAHHEGRGVPADSTISSLMEGAPLLSAIEPGEAPVLTTWERIRSKAPTLPFFLNPRRLPMRAPYNYLAVLGLPILLPTMIVLVLYRFSSESRKSRARVSELDRGWSMEEGNGKDERGRIDLLVRSFMIGAGEEQVDEERSILPTTPAEETHPAHVQVTYDSKSTSSAPSRRSPLRIDVASKKHKQPALLDSQRKMVRTLNDPAAVPRLEKRWTYFDDVVNCECISTTRQDSLLRRPPLQHSTRHYCLVRKLASIC